jgi:hypothetical protein
MPTIEKITTQRPGEQGVPLVGPFERVTLHFDDGNTKVEVSSPPVVLPPVVVTPPATGGLWRPEWLESPAKPVIARTRQATPTTFKSVWESRTRGDEILLACDGVYDGAVLKDAFRLDKNDMRLGSYGSGAPPKLVFGGNFQVLSISGARVEVDGIDIESLKAVRYGTSCIWNRGKDIRLANVRFAAAGEHCINNQATAKRVEMLKCSNLKPTPGYFAYSNGSDFAMLDCVINQVGLSAYRGNECSDQYIAGCTIRGKKNDDLSSVITFAYLSRIAFVGNTVIDAKLNTGPNPDRNGFEQATGNLADSDAAKYAALLAKSCDEGDIRDNEWVNGKINIGVLSTDIRLSNNKGNPQVVVAANGSVKAASGKVYSLPGAKRVVKDGVVVA